jgi:drug/metabolite transporter (DMT)-like permease
LVPFLLFYKKIDFKLFVDKTILTRNLFAAVALFLEVASLKYLTLSMFILIAYTAPIFSKIFARFILSEEISSFDLMLICVSLFGTLFILDFSLEGSQLTGVLLAFSGALFYALCLVTTKKIKSNDTYSIYLSYILVLVVLSAINLPSTVPHKNEFMILFAMAAIHIAAFWLHMKGLMALKTSRAVILEYIGLVFAMIFDWVFWKKLLSFPQFLGGALIVSASLISIYRVPVMTSFKKVHVFVRNNLLGSMSKPNE